MALNWQPVNGDFYDQLYNVLKAFEAPHYDARLVNGNLTIGLGFDLRTGSDELKRQVLLAMGLVDPVSIADPTARAIEQGYWNQLLNAFNGTDPGALDTIMAARWAKIDEPAYNAAIPQASRKTVFRFDNDAQIRNVFDAVAYDDYLKKIETRYHIISDKLSVFKLAQGQSTGVCEYRFVAR